MLRRSYSPSAREASTTVLALASLLPGLLSAIGEGRYGVTGYEHDEEVNEQAIIDREYGLPLEVFSERLVMHGYSDCFVRVLMKNLHYVVVVRCIHLFVLTRPLKFKKL